MISNINYFTLFKIYYFHIVFAEIIRNRVAIAKSRSAEAAGVNIFEHTSNYSS